MDKFTSAMVPCTEKADEVEVSSAEKESLLYGRLVCQYIGTFGFPFVVNRFSAPVELFGAFRTVD